MSNSRKKPRKGQIRDVNSVLLTALFTQAGAAAKSYGIIRDNAEDLNQALNTAVSQCHMVLISGGSSVGRKDATAGVIEQNGRMLFHGIAMNPGKPTNLVVLEGKPVFGLPGHPVAAYLVSQLFALPLLRILTGRREKRFCIRARLCESLSSQSRAGGIRGGYACGRKRNRDRAADSRQIRTDYAADSFRRLYLHSPGLRGPEKGSRSFRLVMGQMIRRR